MVKETIVSPILAMSAVATSATLVANASRSLYIDSTERVPRMARRWPSSVCSATFLISSTFFDSICSAAVVMDTSSPRILTCATPSTVTATPCSVYTLGVFTSRVMISSESSSTRSIPSPYDGAHHLKDRDGCAPWQRDTIQRSRRITHSAAAGDKCNLARAAEGNRGRDLGGRTYDIALGDFRRALRLDKQIEVCEVGEHSDNERADCAEQHADTGRRAKTLCRNDAKGTKGGDETGNGNRTERRHPHFAMTEVYADVAAKVQGQMDVRAEIVHAAANQDEESVQNSNANQCKIEAVKSIVHGGSPSDGQHYSLGPTSSQNGFTDYLQ